MELPENVRRDFRSIRDALARDNHDVRLVGGSVRDLVMETAPKDYDFATTAPPERVMKTFSNYALNFEAHPTGIQHGTVTVVIRGTPYEVTTLRVDKKTDGRRAEVEFTDDWQADAARRDFTINAMYMDLDGRIYDYYNGRQDLARREVRFVGDPVDRIREDYLRILRFFRFHSLIGNANVLPVIEDAIVKNAEGLKGISGERIWSELTKTLSGPNRYWALKWMNQTRVTDHIGLPTPVEGMFYVSEAKNSSWIAALAALIRDVKTLEVCRNRWKFDNASYGILRYVIENRRERTSVDWAKAAIVNGVNPTHLYHLAVFVGDWETAEYAKSSPPIPKFPVNGNDIKAIGMSGKAIGESLDFLRDIWVKSGYNMDKTELMSKLVVAL